VVPAERLDAQVGRLSEITDSKKGWHEAIVRSPPGGESNTQMRLDSPFAPAPTMVTPRKEEPNMGIELKGVIAEYVKAVNAHNNNAIMATFAKDAYVNDNRRHMAGVDAIQDWVAKEVVGDKLTIDVREVVDHYGDTIVIGAYAGTFDKTSLPKELILTSYFSVRDNMIVSLAIIFNQRSPY
jgi:SnoaL-like protein